MSNSAYQTTTGKHYQEVLKHVKVRLQEEILTNMNLPKEVRYEPRNETVQLPGRVFLVTGSMKDISQFNYPLLLTEVKRDGLMVVDVRPFTKQLLTGEVLITSKDEFDSTIIRAGLESYALDNHLADLRSLGNFPMAVYVRWVSEAISRKMGLNPDEQRKVSCALGALYYAMFNDYEENIRFSQLSERDKNGIASSISRSTFISAEDVFQVLDAVKTPIRDIPSFCEAISNDLGILRLERFNPGVLQQIVSGSWMGLNSREMSIVALEHPPTFFSMLYTALTSRGFKKCHLTTVVEISNKKGDGDQWLRALLSLGQDVLPIYKRG